MKSSMATFFAVMTISGAVVPETVAQEFLPLEQLIKKPKDHVEPSYPFVSALHITKPWSGI
jgi:hypothetical protein